MTHHTSKKPLRKLNFLAGLVFILSSVADWKEAGITGSTGWSIALYVASVFMFLISWGPFSSAFEK